jgi:hypothetical protein
MKEAPVAVSTARLEMPETPGLARDQILKDVPFPPLLIPAARAWTPPYALCKLLED